MNKQEFEKLMTSAGLKCLKVGGDVLLFITAEDVLLVFTCIEDAVRLTGETSDRHFSRSYGGWKDAWAHVSEILLEAHTIAL